ncbi:MAG: DUF3352 domain-containing protein [Candidatus Limnocylindrales bacterium]
MTEPTPAGAGSGWALPPVRPVTTRARAPWVRPWRSWLAILVTLLVIAAGAGMAVVTTRETASSTLAYVPANAIIYVEGRTDLPGDQAIAVASLLSRFPGLTAGSGPANSGTANSGTAAAGTAGTGGPSNLGQAWDRLLGKLAGTHYTYTGDLAPWLQGPVGVAVLPDPAGSRPVLVGLVAVGDQARAQAELDKIVADATAHGSPPARSSVGGTPTWTFLVRGPGDGTPGSPQHVLAALLPGMLVIATDRAAITAVQAVKAGAAPGLASSPAYLDASSGTAASDLASIFVSAAALQPGVAARPGASAPGAQPSSAGSCASGLLPTAAYGTLRARGDGLVADLQARLPLGASTGMPRVSTLVDHVPPTAVAYLESHDLGSSVACLVSQAGQALPGALPGASSRLDGALRQIQSLLGTGLDTSLSWLGDAGFVIEPSASNQPGPALGLLATVTDPGLAGERLAQLHALAGLLAAGDPSRFRLSDLQRGPATISTLTIAGPLPSAPGPAGGTAGPVASLSISWALYGGRFFVGTGHAVVEGLMDQAPGASLGASPVFQAALGAAGGPATTGFAYLDLRGMRSVAESLLPSASQPAYTAVRPYLLPFDRLVVVRGVNGSTVTTQAILTIGNPG